MRSQILIIYPLVIVCLVEACGPGRGGGRRLMRRKYPPLVQRQYIPNVSENTLGASGRPEGAIKRKDKRFKELVQNRNPDIEFRDDEGTGADRMMSQRLKEKLSTLAISVMNQWPNVKLRVIEGWDEDNKHSLNSLHYEGRAVDITTNDRDKSKYGMLARLAVEAGFDWVHYESRSHVHCSVKSEKADSIRNNGCFDAASLVETPNGQVQISDLQSNDLVLTMNSLTGQLHYSPFLMWLDRDDLAEELFVELTTKSNRVLRLTSSHLIYLADEPIDLAQAQTTQQLGANDLLSFVADGSHEKQHNNHTGDDPSGYYQYALEDGTTDESVAGHTGSGSTNGSIIVPKDVATAVDQQQQLPKITSSLARGQQRPPTIDEITYTTYARNSLVGQYLLINDGLTQEQRQVPNDHDDDGGQANTIVRVAADSGAAASLRYDLLDNRNTKTRPASRLIYPNKQPQIGQPWPVVKFDQIVSVNFVTRSGRFAPLTREGNIVVNSVVVSCYAVISDHDMAHLSFAPVRWLSYLQEWLFGFKTPMQHTAPRTTKQNLVNLTLQDANYELDTQQQLYKLEPGSTEADPPARSDSQDDCPEEQQRIGVHWYPKLLYRIARYVLPTRFLY